MIGPSGKYSTGGVFFAIRLRCRESYEYASGSIVTTYFLLRKTASSIYMLTISVVHDIVLDVRGLVEGPPTEEDQNVHVATNAPLSESTFHMVH